MRADVRSVLWIRFVTMLLVVLATTVLPRVANISAPPSTDEGYMAYFAMKIAASVSSHGRLPDDGPLMLYPMLLSWIFELPGNHSVLLRIADLVVASVAGGLLFFVLLKESRSVLAAAAISSIFLLTMNAAVFVQYGFKNSFFAAYVPLLAALLLSGKDGPLSARRYASIGVLVALGVLLRETLAPFVVFAVAAIWISRGFRSTLHFCAGGAAAGLSLLALIALWRGDFEGLVAGYKSAGLLYRALENQRQEYFNNAVSGFFATARLPLILATASLLIIVLRQWMRRNACELPKATLWLGITLTALIEPATKIGFPYHFAVCLLGLAGLCAQGWRVLIQGRPPRQAHAAASLFAAATALMIAPQIKDALKTLPYATREAYRVARSGWPAEIVNQSNYLMAARLIQATTPPAGTVSVSGFMFSLYPLSGALPPSSELSNLSGELIQLGLDGERLKAELIRCSPDVVMTTTRVDWPDPRILTAAVEATGLYEVAGTIPVDTSKSYGTFGGTVYRKTKPGGHACRD